MNGADLFLLFGASFLIGFSGAVSPGPMLALSIREGLNHGFWAGPSIATGHSLLELLVVVVLVLGVGSVLQTTPVTAALSFVGGTFLLWMAWGMVRIRSEAIPQLRGTTLLQARDPRKPFLNGALVSLANPFWFLWWMSIGATLLTRSYELGLAGIAAFYLGHILSDFSWFSLVTLVVATGRRWLTAPVYRGIMMVCGVFLAGMGGYFLFSGVQLLR